MKIANSVDSSGEENEQEMWTGMGNTLLRADVCRCHPSDDIFTGVSVVIDDKKILRYGRMKTGAANRRSTLWIKDCMYESEIFGYH